MVMRTFVKGELLSRIGSLPIHLRPFSLPPPYFSDQSIVAKVRVDCVEVKLFKCFGKRHNGYAAYEPSELFRYISRGTWKWSPVKTPNRNL